MTAASNPMSFALQAARLHRSLQLDGVPVRDMRRAPAFELQYAGMPSDGGSSHGQNASRRIEPVEGIIQQRLITPAPVGSSRIRYFLDGVQRTLPFVWIGTIPVAATIVAAGIIDRVAGEECTLARGTLRMKHCLLAPFGLDHPHLNRLIDQAEASGMDVIDILAADPDRDERIAADLDQGLNHDYGRLAERIHVVANRVRERVESDLLADFGNSEHAGKGVLLVDGRLPSPASDVYGVVKQFTNSYLSGPELATLLALPTGYRTTAFHPPPSRRSDQNPVERTMWYMRLWDNQGQDARHSLVRIEAARSVQDPAVIDQVSSWILAERTPRATGDGRWATLLYPVHMLERMLKQVVDRETVGWAGHGR